MNFNQKHQSFIEREKKQAQTKRTKVKQLLEEVELHEANYKLRRFAGPRISFFNILLTISGLIALLLIAALILAIYLKAVSI